MRRPKAVRPIAMYIDRRYLGAKLLEKIVPILACQSCAQERMAEYVRSTRRVSDQLVQSDGGTSLEMTLCIVSDPRDIQTRCDVEAHSNHEKGKVPSTDGGNSCKQDVA